MLLARSGQSDAIDATVVCLAADCDDILTYAAEVSAIIATKPRHGEVPAEAQVVIDQLAACGSCDQVREQLEPWGRRAANIVMIGLPPAIPGAPSKRPSGPRRQHRPPTP